MCRGRFSFGVFLILICVRLVDNPVPQYYQQHPHILKGKVGLQQMANTKSKQYTVWSKKQGTTTFQQIRFLDDKRAIEWAEKSPYCVRLTNDKDAQVWP